ncbi:hypothetical protein [Cecembia lonarensis]|uniref:Lipoprotein n=1 Tax=Cecembia lonarensis (strain CCUG 58316 / KCTC 22772 / LW9) TaxID=1225176 RepID=K1L999_CECL9|nr:hypothetical protein [Cecembia lonarensis]EKB48732.1 hypothetical protein B879_02627 [Cecembia lonarensis LW9]
MKNPIYILPLVLLFLFSACSNEEQMPTIGGFTLDRVLTLKILDEEGNDLLDPDHERYLDPSKIKVFYERDGRMVEFIQSHLDMPRNFRVDPPHEFQDTYLMFLVLDSEKTVIQWNENESDTIRAEFFKYSGRDFLLKVTKVFFNGELKWDVESKSRRKVTIIKPIIL